VLSLKEIKAPIANDMADFEGTFRASMKSNVPLLDKITHYIVKRKGKKVRPMFVFLSAKMHGGVNESSHHAAALIELLHTATLVHDDVVDDAHLRRGMFSINALWKNKIAVLVGDYLLSQGLLLSIENEQYQLLQLVSRAVKEMSEGELLQIQKTRRLNMDENIYFEIIRQKTATLIGACCASGAASTGADKETIDKMWAFGEKVGIAFQLKDDLFDYGNGEEIGKPTGLDIKEKKVTLPLLYTLNNCPGGDRRRIINLVKNHHDDGKKVKEVVAYVKKYGGIPYAVEKMHEYRDQAIALLSDIPDSEAKLAMEGLVNYTIARTK